MPLKSPINFRESFTPVVSYYFKTHDCMQYLKMQKLNKNE